jgi:hypothetical protein
MQQQRERELVAVGEGDWNAMFAVGGLTFILAGILFLVALIGEAMLGSLPSSSASAELAYINSHSQFYLIAYVSQIAAGFLFFPSLFATYLALRKTSRTLASTAFGTMIVGIPIYLAAGATAFSALALANSYASGTSSTLQAGAALGAGFATLTSLNMLAKVTDFVFATGSILNGIAFAKSKYFGRPLGGIVLAAAILVFLGTLLFFDALALATLLFAVAFMITGWKLYSLSRKSVPL